LSKIKKNKINFNDDDFLVNVEINERENDGLNVAKKHKRDDEKENPEFGVFQSAEAEKEEILSNAKEEASEIIQNANREAELIIENAKKEINASALDEKEKILQDAKKEAFDLLNNSKEELENLRIQTTKTGYDDGYNDGLTKIREELEEKINDFDNFIAVQKEVKEKILKSATGDILDVICELSKKVILKETDAETLEKIIRKTISMLEKKDDVNIILSTKYAKLLLQLQNKSLDKDEELKLEDFKQYKNFNIIYNDKFAPDTIIVENIKERFDASVSSQLDVILRNILENKDEY